MSDAARRIVGGLALALAIVATGATAQTAANGPYYATPSWDQTIPVASRYVVLTNLNGDAVLDRETGLVWQRTRSASFYNWTAAYRLCLNLQLGNRRGWRLPTAAEMLSLFDATTLANPGLPTGHPFLGFDPRGGLLWTSTQERSSNFPVHFQVIYLVGVYEPFANPTNDGGDSHVLCVRSSAPLGGLPD